MRGLQTAGAQVNAASFAYPNLEEARSETVIKRPFLDVTRMCISLLKLRMSAVSHEVGPWTNSAMYNT